LGDEIAALTPPPAPDAEVFPREPEAVSRAIETAPGLSDIGEAKLGVLRSELESGACLTDALVEATGSINRHTLAVMMREIELNCAS